MAALLVFSLLDSSNTTMSKASLLKSEEQRIDAAAEPVIGAGNSESHKKPTSRTKPGLYPAK